MPERALSVSRQISERIDWKPLSLRSRKGEEANSAVESGCSASETLSLRTMSASLAKSRLTWTVQVRNIMSRPIVPTFGM